MKTEALAIAVVLVVAAVCSSALLVLAIRVVHEVTRYVN